MEEEDITKVIRAIIQVENEKIGGKDGVVREMVKNGVETADELTWQSLKGSKK